jgi:hypothetical protein
MRKFYVNHIRLLREAEQGVSGEGIWIRHAKEWACEGPFDTLEQAEEAQVEVMARDNVLPGSTSIVSRVEQPITKSPAWAFRQKPAPHPLSTEEAA